MKIRILLFMIPSSTLAKPNGPAGGGTAPRINETALPRWDLNKLYGYSNLTDDNFQQDFNRLNQQSKELYEKYEGRLKESLEEALVEYQLLNERYRELDQFVGSVESVWSVAGSMKQVSKFRARRDEIYGEYLEWFVLELIEMPESVLGNWLATSDLVRSLEPWIRQTRQTHALTRPVERAITIRENWYGTSPLVQYFIELLTKAKYRNPEPRAHDDEREEGEGAKSLRVECPRSIPSDSAGASPGAPPSFPPEGTLSESRLLNYLLDERWEVREAALRFLNEGLEEQQLNRFSCLSLNQVAGRECIENKERGWTTVRSARNFSNQVSDALVDALIQAVTGKGAQLNKRFYNLKKRILQAKTGRREFTWADRNAPLLITKKTDAPPPGEEEDGAVSRPSGGRPPLAGVYEWSDCVDLVKSSFDEFSEVFGSMFVSLLQEGRVDAGVSEGKRGGAFCMLGTGTVGPVVFVNYLGGYEDVTTVAHECGHAIHGTLTYTQPFLMQDPSTAVAEVASMFGEMLVFQKMVKEEEDDERRLDKIMTKLNSVMNTVVRQMSFDRFEELVHTARQQGFVSEEEMTAFWVQATHEFYGKPGEVFTAMDHIDHLWSYVPHFHQLPFYVYSYPLADLTVGMLYALYQNRTLPSDHSLKPHPDSFQYKFIQLLSAGNSQPYTQLLQPFGLDPTHTQFWEEALTLYIEPLLTQAEELTQQLYGTIKN